MGLSTSLSLLGADYDEFDEASIETGMDPDEALGQAIVTLEAYSNHLDELDTAMEALESGETTEFTLESLGRLGLHLKDTLTLEGYPHVSLKMPIDAEFYGMYRGATLTNLRNRVPEGFSMESIELSLEAEVGGISNIFERIWQAEFMTWLTQFDWVADLVKSSAKNAKKYRERLEGTLAKLNKKKPKLTQHQHVGSYVKMENYWVTDKGFVKDIFGTLKSDLDMATYCTKTYPKLIEGEMDKFSAVLRSARTESSQSMEVTAMKGLIKLQHPAYLFDKKYLGGRPYLMHTGLKMHKKKKVGDDPYESLVHPNRVAISKRPYFATGRMLVGDVYHDVKLSTREIEELLGWGHKFLDLSESVLNNNRSMENRVSSLKAAMETLIKRSKESKDKALVKQVKLLGKHAKNLVDCYWSPAMKCAKRNIEVAKGIDYLADRMVAVAK